MEIEETTVPLLVVINIFTIVVGGMIGISLTTICASKHPIINESYKDYTINPNLISSECSRNTMALFISLLMFYSFWCLGLFFISIYYSVVINTLMIIRAMAYSIIMLLNWINLIDPILRLFFMSNGIYGEANFNSDSYVHSSFFLMYLAMFSAIFICFEVYAGFKNFDKEVLGKLEISCLLSTIIISLFGFYDLFLEYDLLDSTKLRGVIYEEIQNYLFLNQSDFLDTLQTQLQCCGETGWEDYVRKIDGAQLIPCSCVEPYLNTSCIDELVPYINKRWGFTISYYIIYIIFQIMAIIWIFNSFPSRIRTKITSDVYLMPYIKKTNGAILKGKIEYTKMNML